MTFTRPSSSKRAKEREKYKFCGFENRFSTKTSSIKSASTVRDESLVDVDSPHSSSHNLFFLLELAQDKANKKKLQL